MNKLIPVSLVLLGLTACASFDPGSLITDTRVLGAEVEVEGDPQRTTPRPGESAKLSLLLAGLDAAPEVKWALVVCRPGSSQDAACQGEPLAVASGTGSTPTLTLTVPGEAQLGATKTLQVGGIVCQRGEPELSNDGPRCAGEGADGTTLVYELALARAVDGSDENLAPQLVDTALRFDDEAWTTTSIDTPSCAGQALPTFHADEKEHAIDIELGPNVRELAMGDDGKATFEELQLSHFVTAGELSRQFSFVEPTDLSERPKVTVKWTAPKANKLVGDSQTASLTLIVRDMRGGIARTERVFCIVR
ncbi:MAG: hypothetical protein RLZZ450_675 [Pseudomonadota bacterium]|jgi:hypothetical protein